MPRDRSRPQVMQLTTPRRRVVGMLSSRLVLFRSYGCHPHFQSRRCSSAGFVLSAARFSTRTSWNQSAASREKRTGGRYGLASRVRSSRLRQPQGTRSSPARRPCRPLKSCSRPRFAPAPYRVRGPRPCSRRPAPRR